MVQIQKIGTDFRFLGGGVAIGAMAAFYDTVKNQIVGRANVDRFGGWEIVLPASALISGHHEMRFFGGDCVEAMPSASNGQRGSWRGFTLLLTDDDVGTLASPVEVHVLRGTNTDNAETGNSPSQFIDLEWTDVKTLGVENFPFSRRAGQCGCPMVVTYEQSRHIVGYDVYMFVSTDTSIPSARFPGGNPEGHGSWYLVSTVANNRASIRCPVASVVAFWVGMRMTKTPIVSQYGTMSPMTRSQV